MKNILSQFMPSFKIIGLDIENPGPNLIAIDLGSLSNPFCFGAKR